MFAKQSSVEYILEELGGCSPVVGVEGSGGVVRTGVCQFEKDRNSPSSNNSLPACWKCIICTNPTSALEYLQPSSSVVRAPGYMPGV